MSFYEDFGVFAAVLMLVAGIAVAVIINATGLRLAALWLGLGRIPVRKAFSCTIMMMLAPAAISFQNAFQASMLRSIQLSSLRQPGRSSFRDEAVFDYGLINAISPNLLSSVAILCVVAAIISCAVPTRDAEPPIITELSFRESVALTTITILLTTLFGATLGLIAFGILKLVV